MTLLKRNRIWEPHKWRNPHSIGNPLYYQMVSYMVVYSPYLWRKVARYLGNVRRLNRFDYRGDNYHRSYQYARQAFKDMKLPDDLKAVLREAMQKEFNFDVDPL